jgi:hypothetical protein
MRVPELVDRTSLSDSDSEILRQLALAFRLYRATPRFGIFLTSSHLIVNEGEVLVEDFPRRGQSGLIHAVPVSQATLGFPTHWTIDRAGRVLPERFRRTGLLPQ